MSEPTTEELIESLIEEIDAIREMGHSVAVTISVPSVSHARDRRFVIPAPREEG